MNQVYDDIEQYIPQLKRYALSMTRNSAAAEDLVQDCLARALAKSELFEPGTNLRAWLFTIMHNLHASDRRKQPAAGRTVDPEFAPAAIAERPRQDQALVAQTLMKALQGLPRPQRRTLKMATIDGRAYEDIAEELQVSVGTVKSRVARGRVALREELEGAVEPGGDAESTRRIAAAGAPSLDIPRPNGPATGNRRKH